MGAELVGAVHRDEGADGHETAIALRELGRSQTSPNSIALGVAPVMEAAGELTRTPAGVPRAGLRGRFDRKLHVVLDKRLVAASSTPSSTAVCAAQGGVSRDGDDDRSFVHAGEHGMAGPLQSRGAIRPIRGAKIIKLR
jgi:hypothetical protein